MAIAPDLAELTAGNQSFSRQLPGLQLFVDSTSLGQFKTCPRQYFYSVICGYQPRHTSVHLKFGIWLHGGAERYWHARAAGQEHEGALLAALSWCLEETWEPALNRGWISEHPQKTRVSLVRSLIWYLDEVAQNDALQTLHLANGKPAVELSFSFDSGLASSVSGEAWWFCGHLDRIASLNGVPYIVDIKTTGSALAPSFFQSFSPDNQFSLYTLAGKVAFQTPVAGIIVDGVQVGATFARFQRQPVERSPAQVDEWFGDAQYWLQQMETCAERQYWPMNDKACGLYGGCKYRQICGRSPAARQLWLEADYVKQIWDPLVRRGEV